MLFILLKSSLVINIKEYKTIKIILYAIPINIFLWNINIWVNVNKVLEHHLVFQNVFKSNLNIKHNVL